VAFVITTVLTIPGVASGATYAVNTTDDGSGPCTPSHCTLRGAIEDANSNPGPDQVGVRGGREYPLELGQLLITDRATVRATGDEHAAIDAQDESRVWKVDAPGDSVALHGLRMSHGASPRANSGGAIFVRNGSLLVRDSEVHNSVTRGSGGGISVFTGATLSLRRSAVVKTTSDGLGGAISINGSADIRKSTIANNHNEGEGGGIYNGEWSYLQMVNSTIARNTAGLDGGGLLNYGTAKLNSVTITRNSAYFPAGLDNGGHMTVTNTLVALNSSEAGTPDCGGVFDSRGYNLIGGPLCPGFDGPGDFTDPDPMLGPLANNGGPTRTIALQPGSSAIGAANPASSPPTDQRDVPRDPQPDIGAYEAP
jgi:CSLREA domain-containing protein